MARELNTRTVLIEEVVSKVKPELFQGDKNPKKIEETYQEVLTAVGVMDIGRALTKFVKAQTKGMNNFVRRRVVKYQASKVVSFYENR